MAYEYAGASQSKSGRKTPKLERILVKLTEFAKTDNLAYILPDQPNEQYPHGLEDIGQQVIRGYEIDKRSRTEWEEMTKKAMDIALQIRQPKNYPWPGAANIKYPLVTVAALQFGARAYPAIVDGNRIVKAQILGSDEGVPVMTPQGPAMQQGPDGQPMPVWQTPPGFKRDKADRVSQHMSYQLLTEMEEWEEDTDVLLHHIPIIGCAMRKVYRSDELKRNKSEMIPAIHLVVNNRVRNLVEAPRITHEVFLYPQEIEERKRNGTFLDIELPSPATGITEEDSVDGDDDSAPSLFLEQHCFFDLDEDGYKEPYIVTVHKDCGKVVRMVANYSIDEVQHDAKRIIRIPKGQYFVKYSFIPDPKGGFYDIGFGKLLESLGETIDTTINQMLDAGHLQVAGGGFIGTGVRFKKRNLSLTPGKYEQVEINGKLGDQIYNHQFPGPSAVLFSLLGMMVEAARDITAVKDILTGDTGDKGVQTATTTLALIEQGLKVFTAIYKRVYRSLKKEYKLLFALNAKYMEDKTYFTFLDKQQAVAKSDYDVMSLDIMPVADPKMVTDMQRGARANVLLQIAGSPLGVAQNPVEALKRVYDSLGIEEAEKLIVQQQGPTPEQQLAMANAEAEIKQKQAQATKHEAEAAFTLVRAHLAPFEAEHTAQMNENKAVLSAAQYEDQQRKDMQEGLRADKHKAIDVMMEESGRDHELSMAEKQMNAKMEQMEDGRE